MTLVEAFHSGATCWAFRRLLKEQRNDLPIWNIPRGTKSCFASGMVALKLGPSRVEEWWGAGKARLLVVVGLQDVVAPPENGRLIKDEFGDRVTLQEIDGAGHAMLPERPKQVAAAVLNFLKPQSK